MDEHSQDVFRPRSGSAQAIYDAFKAEARLRGSRSFVEWSEAEKQAVLSASISVARRDGLPELAMRDIERMEIEASGHVDYGLKWACGVVELMHRRKREMDAARSSG